MEIHRVSRRGGTVVDDVVDPCTNFAIASADPVERDRYRRMYGFVGNFLTKKTAEMNALLKRFLADERALETVEYAVMTALIVAAVALAATTLATAMTGRFTATKIVIDGV